MRGTRLAGAFTFAAFGWWFCGGDAALAHDDCSTANAEICINVGETAKIKVTNRLLQTLCVNSLGQPDDELVQPTVSGEPDTGGAGATFSPQVFRAYSGFSTLSIRTTIETKPGNYTIDIGGRGERCGLYHGHRTYLLVRPKINGRSILWSFNGAEPDGYPTEVILTALPANRPPYRWFLTGSTQWLRFPNNQSFIATNVNRVKVTAIRPNFGSAQPSIFVDVANGLSLTKHIDVLTPFSLRLRGHKHFADPKSGYRSVWTYAALDQFGQLLPETELPVRIDWTSSQTEIRANNWTRSPSGRRAMSDPYEIRLAILPRTDAGVPVNTGNPRPLVPSQGTTKVDCWRTAIYLGGDDTHPGVRVDRQIWLRYRDHGTTEATRCP